MGKTIGLQQESLNLEMDHEEKYKETREDLRAE